MFLRNFLLIWKQRKIPLPDIVCLGVQNYVFSCPYQEQLFVWLIAHRQCVQLSISRMSFMWLVTKSATIDSELTESIVTTVCIFHSLTLFLLDWDVSGKGCYSRQNGSQLEYKNVNKSKIYISVHRLDKIGQLNFFQVP